MKYGPINYTLRTEIGAHIKSRSDAELIAMAQKIRRATGQRAVTDAELRKELANMRAGK